MSVQTAVADYAKIKNLQPVSTYDFYRDLFPEGTLDKTGALKKGKFTALINRVNDVNIYLHDDLTGLKSLSPNDQAYISPVGYAGNCLENRLAMELYALVVRFNLPEDADGKTIMKTFTSHRCIKKSYTSTDANGTVKRVAPIESTNPSIPTYIVVSGNRVFLYYMFDYPIKLFEGCRKSLESAVTYISKEVHLNLTDTLQREVAKPQQENLLNRYPVVGTMVAGEACTAYKTGKRWSVYDLNAFLPKSKMIHYLHEKAERIPTWLCSKSIYNAFLRRVEDNVAIAKPGCFEALASYARKCFIDEVEFHADQFKLFKLLADSCTYEERVEHKNHSEFLFQNEEDKLKTWSLDYIEKITGIPIPRNKRNGRTQSAHLKKVHESQSKEKEVEKWRKANPEGSIDDCAKALCISRKTAKRWWEKKTTSKQSRIPKICDCGNEHLDIRPERWLNSHNGNYYARTIYVCSECGQVLYKTKSRVDN